MNRRAKLLVAIASVGIATLLAKRAHTEPPQDEESTEENAADDVPPPPSSSDPAIPAPPPPSADGMIAIAGTTFHMGSTAPKAEPNESPVHQVTVSPFFVDRIEVTVGAYADCVSRGVCVAPKVSTKNCTWGRDPALPMNCVSHEEAETFCFAAKKRLPTEAEWELAAKGSSDRRYPWGDESPDCDKAITMKGNTTAESCSAGGPKPAGRNDGRSRAGALDMAGNVEEWVSDRYDDRYQAGDQKDPRGPAVGTAFVLRGGGFLSPRIAARVTARSWGSMAERGANVGFRCARDGAR